MRAIHSHRAADLPAYPESPEETLVRERMEKEEMRMKGSRLRQRTAMLLAAVAAMTVLSPRLNAAAGLPDSLVMDAGGVADVLVSLPLSAEVTDSGVIERVSRLDGGRLSLTAGQTGGTSEVVFRLMGVVPVKTVTVTVEQPRRLIPGGRSLGVALETDGVVVVGSSGLGKEDSPAHAAGIRPGDVIQTIDGQPVHGAQMLTEALADGEAVTVGVLREGEKLSFEVLPGTDPRDGVRKLGVWVRENTAGVGTLTYYDPESGEYGALGHAVTDVDTGVVFPVGQGAVYQNEVVHITPGEQNAPGELTGGFFEDEIVLGGIDKNTDFGVFGSAQRSLADGGLYPEGLPVGRRGEIHTGSAQILSTIDGGAVKAYDCEIEKLYSQNRPQTRSMILRITDPELLDKTGGIVQGMSGSPIVQDGKIVGAVTHVFVSDPSRGYGVYIEWMLDAAA